MSNELPMQWWPYKTKGKPDPGPINIPKEFVAGLFDEESEDDADDE